MKRHISNLANILKLKGSHKARSVPICLFTYHKCGSVLLAKIFKEICKDFGWEFASLLGRQIEIPPQADLVLYCHSIIDPSDLETPFIGVHFIRDPRDIIVSGYLYHRRTEERWCTNTDFRLEQPILYPRVPYSHEHLSESIKADYLESLGGKSYQKNLLSLSQTDGLLFEMNHYSAFTIENMQRWNYNKNNILEVRFESLMTDYDNTFQRIFEHLGFSKSQVSLAMGVAIKHDLRRKTDMEIDAIRHVFARETNKWKDYFEEVHKIEFLRKFGTVLVDLGWEKTNDW